MYDPVCIAVIGTGLIGKHHIYHVSTETTTRLVAIVESLAFGRELAARNSVPCFSTIEKLIAAKNDGSLKVEAAIIATTTATQVPLGIELLQAGINVLVQKPIALNL
jgi:predicted dehydrogenase